MRSDLWVFRYIWDTVEQQEVLAAIVGDAVKVAPQEENEHPAPAPTRAPDPESLARDLDDLEKRLSRSRHDAGRPLATEGPTRRARRRCEWIKDERQARVPVQAASRRCFP